MVFSLDLFIIAGIFGGFLALAFMLGRGKTVALYLSLYIGLLLYAYFPYTEKITNYASTPFEKSLFLAGILLVLTGLAYMAIKESVDSFSVGLGEWLDSVVLALIGTGLTLAVLHHTLPFGTIHKFPSSVSSFFTFEHAFFWWLMGGLAALFVLLRR